MYRIYTLLFLLFSMTAHAQPKGYHTLKNTAAFRESLALSGKTKQTIVSDFVQTKHLSLLEDRISSKGKFYFRKENKVRIEYITPYVYLLIMNNGQILVKDEQKTSRVSTRNSRVMQSVNRIIIDCMQGSVFLNPDFSVSVYENNTTYLLSLLPVHDAMKKLFQQIEVQMDKKDLDVTRLTMTEQGGDFTHMDFTNTRHNVALNEALFQVK